ncbi:hypothetical protein PIB30_058432 [Stylosanthes scabra]|uniref:Uncharacterized protein n=1 Tax=Stylosanthes scabra TaxID=79078 RepID=A0ABU6ZIQ2_9FABA|nr:hypothetical protein [Stylosanthes scabra]
MSTAAPLRPHSLHHLPPSTGAAIESNTTASSSSPHRATIATHTTSHAILAAAMRRFSRCNTPLSLSLSFSDFSLVLTPSHQATAHRPLPIAHRRPQATTTLGFPSPTIARSHHSFSLSHTHSHTSHRHASRSASHQPAVASRRRPNKADSQSTRSQPSHSKPFTSRNLCSGVFVIAAHPRHSRSHRRSAVEGPPGPSFQPQRRLSI